MSERGPMTMLTEFRQDEKGRWNLSLSMSMAQAFLVLGDLPKDGMPVLVTFPVEPMEVPGPPQSERAMIIQHFNDVMKDAQQ